MTREDILVAAINRPLDRCGDFEDDVRKMRGRTGCGQGMSSVFEVLNLNMMIEDAKSLARAEAFSGDGR